MPDPSNDRRFSTLIPVLLALPVAFVLASASPAPAQGVHDPDAIDKIVGSEVEEEEVEAAAEPQRVIAAIEKTSENIGAIRMLSALDRIDIVFLADAAVIEGGPPREIEEHLEANRSQIVELQREIEGNAMVYHAINARQILPRDILAVEFEDPARLVIYAAAAKPAAN
jgi:hypothetical protein